MREFLRKSWVILLSSFDAILMSFAAFITPIPGKGALVSGTRMNSKKSALLVAILLVSSALVVMVSSPAAAAELNTAPTAQHSDRAVEDGNGDGEVTLRLRDTQSEDPDHVHREGDNLLCELDGETTDGNNGIVGWRWFNATDLNDTQFADPDTRMDRFLDNSDPTKELTFGVGEWTIALRVEDTCGATDWTNFTLEVRPKLEQLFTFDNGSLGPSWTTTGLWHVEDRCDVEADGSYLAYNEYDKDDALSEEDCDYETGTVNSGEAKVVTIDPSKSASSSEASWYRLGIEFDHYFRVGTSALDDEDRMIFEVSFDGGTTWVGSNHTDTGCGGDEDDKGKNCWDDDSDDPTNWLVQTNVFDVRDQDYDGGEIQLRWVFNTTDTHDNNNLGWLVDNVEVFGLVENDPPTAGDLELGGCNANLDDDAGDAPEQHTFSCSASLPTSSDSDGSIIEHRYIWGDGSSTTGPTDNVKHVYPTETGTYSPYGKVTDDGMATATSPEELVEFQYWAQEDVSGDEWDDDGLWGEEDDDGHEDCGIDALSGEEWMAMSSGCSYSSVDRSDHLELWNTIDTSRFADRGDGNEGHWDIRFMHQHELACGDRVDLQIKLDGNDGWNTTREHLDCDNNDFLDGEWEHSLRLSELDADRFETEDGNGNWVRTSEFPDDLDIRLAATGDGGGGTGAFVDDIVFFASSD